MKTNQTTVCRKLQAVFTALVLLMILAGGSATAQDAPPFSSDFLMDDKTYVFLMADRLEYHSISDATPLVWDAQGWIGKEYHKFWVKAEGEALTVEREGEVEFQGLYSRAITPYFDLQAGVRYDLMYNEGENRSRAFGVLGLQGLAPYFFEVDGTVFVSTAGDISANFEAEYDLPITQRLWGQPRVATSVAVQEVEEFGVGSGFNNVQLGFRLRYEIERELAPYIGFSWNRKLGEAADFVRTEGGNASVFGLVAGLRLWM